MEGKDPLIEMNRRAMEYIWNKVPKEMKDGVPYVTYIASDLPYLYNSGMVDTQHYKIEQWLKAFEDCKGEDGRYWVSHEKMLSLGRFRYSKVVNEPFDPLKMRVGRYSVDRLWKVFENSILPSCSLPPEFLKNTFDRMFRQHKKISQIFESSIKDSKEEGNKELKDDDLSKFDVPIETVGQETFVEVTREHLTSLKTFLDTYPSPRRKLEMGVATNRMNKLQQLSDIAKNPQKSSFEGGKDFRESTKKDLKNLLVKASESAGGRKPKGEPIDLKSLQSKRPTKF